jgi:hypothetical protein
MGFIDTSDAEYLPVFYNVYHAVGMPRASHTVGQGSGSVNNTTAGGWSSCPNLPDDVKLVQYLLKAFYDFQPPHVRPQGEMKIDGLCGPVTNRWILQFQRDCNLAGGEQVLLVDNRVDKVLNKNLVSNISKKMYTLAMLNINVKYYSPEVWAKTPLFVPLHNPYGVQISYKGVVTASEAA